MKFIVYISLTLFIYSCGGDQSSNSKSKKNGNSSGKNSIASIEYESSNYKLETQRDSLSYLIGHESSKPFLTDSVFSILNKQCIMQGFEEDVESNSTDDCLMKVQSFMSSSDIRKDTSFTNECAKCVGWLNKIEFYNMFNDLNALDLVDFNSASAGLRDGLAKKYVFRNDTNSVNILFADLNEKLELKYESKVVELQKEGVDFLKKNRKRREIKETASGLQYQVLRKGKGNNPNAASRVRVHYTGKTLSGETFDSSYERGKPTEFGLNQVIPGWTEGLALMNKGAKFKFFIPQELAYGPNPPPTSIIKPYSLLIFEVELLEIL